MRTGVLKLAVFAIAALGCSQHVPLGKDGDSATTGPVARGTADESRNALSQEKRMLRLVQEWKGDADEPLVEAMRHLGRAKCAKAAPALVDKIMLDFIPPNDRREMLVNEGPPWTTYAHAVAALRDIGPPAAPAVAARLGEVDEEKQFVEVYRLRQALLGMMRREEAVAFLRDRARKAKTDEAGRRLLTSAREVATYRIVK